MKLRQKIAIGLCAFYLLSVIGIAANLHFCNEALSSLNFTERASCKVCKSANNQSIVKNDNCSKNNKSVAKVTDQQESSSKAEASKSFGVAAMFAPVIAELLCNLMPGMFPKKDNKGSSLL